MKSTADLSKQGIMLEGNLGPGTIHFSAAEITESLSTITEIRVEFLTTLPRFFSPRLLGSQMRISMNTDSGTPRKFQGLCVAVEYLGSADGFDLYSAEVRPWLWMLTRSRNNRIFQGKTTPEIVEAVCDQAGLSGHTQRLSGSYRAREYCVQYGETDFDFLSRLMEEEGIYYYFDHSGDTEVMVLSDGAGSHDRTTPATIEFKARSRNTPLEVGHVFEFASKTQVTSGAVSLVDYDMLKPNTDLRVTSSIKRGRHQHAGYERYEIDAHYTAVAQGEETARVRMEAEAHRSVRFVGAANAPHIGAGKVFTLTGEPKLKQDLGVLVLSATHFLRGTTEGDQAGALEKLANASRMSFPDYDGRYICRIEVAPVRQPFRPPRVTPWPEIPGLLTAVVVGPSGEEIYTDEHGRIKVQFHWDREGQKDENSTCWVRTVVPWSGRGWGMFGVPRIGQEVVIQFERGNPDHPVCTGMLYNGVTRHPHAFPSNMTMSGVRTNSSKGGGGFHEMVFEDKKGAEYIRMISEKDYFQTIKNNAVISIGQEKKDKGDLTQTIHRHKTETLKTGDHTFTVESGHQTISIDKTHKETIGGTSDTTITGNTTVTVTKGHFTETIKMGNRKREVSMGNDDTLVKLGNISIEAKAGKILITALQEIMLKVGGSTVKLTPIGVETKGMIIKTEAKILAATKGLFVTSEGKIINSIKAPITSVKGNGLLILNGKLTMIN